jgi:hypothetical protein
MMLVPTRYMSRGRRVYKTENGKFVRRSITGQGWLYRPKVTHITKGTQKFTVKPHHSVYYGGKPVAKYSKGGKRISREASLLRRILSRRAM